MRTKTFSFFFTTLILSSSVFGQYFTDIEWQKQKLQAVQVSVPYDEEITEDAIKLHFGRLGITPSQQKGGLFFKSVRIAELGSDVYDLLFKVEKKGRRDSESSDIFFAVSKGNNNYVQPGDTDSLPASMKRYSGQFLGWTEEQALEVEIKKQEDKGKQSQRKLQDLVEDGVVLEKKLQKVQTDIQDNKLQVEKQKLEVDLQAKTLEALLKKRKN